MKRFENLEGLGWLAREEVQLRPNFRETWHAFKGDDFSENNLEGPIVVTIGNFDYAGGFRLNQPE